MARRRIHPGIHTVDEIDAGGASEARPIRLEPNAAADVADEIVRLEPHADPHVPAQKLELPARQEVETRSNEPGIETLIDAERALLSSPEEDWGKAAEEHRPVPWGWFALVGILIISVAGWALWEVLFARKQIDVIRVETEEILSTEEDSVREAVSLVESIGTAVERFARARNVEEMARVVRHPERVRRLMDDYYSRTPFTPLGEIEIEDMNPLVFGNQGDYWIVVMRTGAPDPVDVIVQAGVDADALVDWETFVNYQPMDWDDYATRRPAGSSMDFRVQLTPNMLHSHEFQDAGMWDCYMLTASGSDEILFGYAKKDTSSAETLRSWFQRHPGRQASMILRLSIPDGLKAPRGVVIDEIRAMRWIYLVDPDENP